MQQGGDKEGSYTKSPKMRAKGQEGKQIGDKGRQEMRGWRGREREPEEVPTGNQT